MSDARPFLKWVGGKGRLLEQLEPLLPSDIDERRHVEPFLGGGALFFHRAPKRALLCDANRDLVRTYRTVRDHAEDLIGWLRVLSDMGVSPETYYRVRDRFNAGDAFSEHAAEQLERAALFIYLNRTCFNGVYRVNRKGQFNVPVGAYKNPRILDEEGIRAASRALQGAEVKCNRLDQYGHAADGWFGEDDFVYLDPPYLPVSETANFRGYGADGFTIDDHVKLRDLARELTTLGAKVMISNADLPIVRELYRGFQIDVVKAPRSINSDGKGRGEVRELVIRNYTGRRARRAA